MSFKMQFSVKSFLHTLINQVTTQFIILMQNSVDKAFTPALYKLLINQQKYWLFTLHELLAPGV